MLDDEAVWRTVLVCVGGIQSKFTAAINVCKSLPILVMGSGSEEKADFLAQSKQRAKALNTLNEAVTATKRIAHALFKAMRQAGVSCSQMTLAHYLNSASCEERGGGGGGDNTKGRSSGGGCKGVGGGRSTGFLSNKSNDLRSAMLGPRGGSEGSGSEKEGGGLNSSMISLENALDPKCSSGPAAVIHTIGIVSEASLGLGGEQSFKSLGLDKLVNSGIEFLRQTAGCPNLAASLLAAASVSANVDRGLQAKEMEVYWNNRLVSGDGGGFDRTSSFSIGAKRSSASNASNGSASTDSVDTSDVPKVPPSTPTRAKEKEKEAEKEKEWGGFEESDIGGNFCEKVAVDEEGKFAVQMMWNFKKCACGCSIMDEDILGMWEEEEGKNICRLAKEKIKIIGGLVSSGGGNHMRRNSKSLLDLTSGDDVKRRHEKGDGSGVVVGDFSLDDVKIPVQCLSCRRSYTPTLFFETAYGVELKSIDTSSSSVGYLPMTVVSVLWHAVTALHGRRSTSSPSWLVLNKPQLYHNLVWWTARCPSIPAHIHSPLVCVAWRRGVAKWKAEREMEVVPQLVLSKSSSSGNNSFSGMALEEMFEEEMKMRGGESFVDKVGEALAALRQALGGKAVGGGGGGGLIESVVGILGDAVDQLTTTSTVRRSSVDKANNARDRDRDIYRVLLQLSAHYDIQFLSTLLSVDEDLSQRPGLEAALVGYDAGRFEKIVASTEATAMRAVFGHLF
jgi:hypothetical protein